MTPKELAEKLVKEIFIGLGLSYDSRLKVVPVLESLLTEALKKARKEGFDSAIATPVVCEEAIQEIKAAAYEECAKIADENNGELHDLFEPCECADKIRQLAKDVK